MVVDLKKDERGERPEIVRITNLNTPAESEAPATLRAPSDSSRKMEYIVSGFVIKLKTADPAKFPLTNPTLLLLHAIMSDILWARGGAEAFDSPYDDESSQEVFTPINGSQGWVHDWVPSADTPFDPNTGQTWPDSLPLPSECVRDPELVLEEKELRELERRVIGERRRLF